MRPYKKYSEYKFHGWKSPFFLDCIGWTLPKTKFHVESWQPAKLISQQFIFIFGKLISSLEWRYAFHVSLFNIIIEINDFEIDNYNKFRYVKVDKKKENHEVKPYDYDHFLEYEDEKH